MTKKFALQRVLDLKGQVEDLLQIQMAGIEGQRLELQNRIDSLRAQWAQTSQTGVDGVEEPLDPAQREEWAEYLAALERRIQTHGESLDQVNEQLQAKRAELEANYQERELLQRLKERRAAEDDKDEQRRDIRALDDVNTSRYVRRVATGGAYESNSNDNGNGHNGNGHNGNGHNGNGHNGNGHNGGNRAH